MKKLLFLLSLVTVLFGVASCKQTGGETEVTQIVNVNITWKGNLAAAPANPSTGWMYYDTTQKKTFIWDGTQWQIVAQDGYEGTDGESSTLYLGESTETEDEVTYTVKSYVETVVGDAYLYSYYKYYYSGETLRKVYKFYHNTLSCERDYDYMHFQEHVCGEASGRTEITEFYENGNTKSYVQIYRVLDDSFKDVITYTDQGLKESWKLYLCRNGNTLKLRLEATYNTSGDMNKFTQYYTSGNTYATTNNKYSSNKWQYVISIYTDSYNASEKSSNNLGESVTDLYNAFILRYNQYLDGTIK